MEGRQWYPSQKLYATRQRGDDAPGRGVYLDLATAGFADVTSVAVLKFVVKLLSLLDPPPPAAEEEADARESAAPKGEL